MDQYFDGGDGYDTVIVLGSEGITANIGLAGIERAFGSSGDDVLTAYWTSGSVEISGEGGDDSLAGGTGNDTLNGGTGNDHLQGDKGNDSLAGGTGADTLQGNDGDDLLLGEAGDDLLEGGNGNDTLYGGAGADVLLGEDGDDLIYVDGDEDTVDGGVGFDTVIFQGNHAMHVNLNLWQVERIFGGGGDDVFDAHDAAGGIEIDGGGGNDRLIGSSGDETLRGGDGNDTLDSSYGADLLVGGAGIDTVDYSHSAWGGVTVDLSTGTGSGNHAEGDCLSGIENLIGSIYSDVLTGDAAANRLEGGGGYDTLFGGDGDDTLIGGSGHTLMFGGDGADAFRIGLHGWAAVSINDFESGVDRIELEAEAFGLPGGALNPDTFVLRTASDADDRFIFDPMHGSFSYDADGNGSGDPIVIALLYVGTLSASDIVVVPSGS